MAVCPGYKPLVTEIHFKEDPKKSDSMYRPENAIAPEKRTVNGTSFEIGVFDIVLEREAAATLPIWPEASLEVPLLIGGSKITEDGSRLC